MNKKFGLGKGLGALIPDEIEDEVKDTTNEVSIDSIIPNDRQPRKKFDEENIIQLSESIKEHGIIQPIIVNNEKNKYIIIAGERRWRAAKLAGLNKVPVVIMNLSNKNVLEVSLIENIQRQDLNPIEEANAYKKLIDEYNLTQEELSKRIGKSRTAIANCLRLINLDERVRDYLIDGVISEGHGRALLSLDDGDLQYSIAQTIIDENLSVRETERIIKNIGDGKIKKEKDPEEYNPYYNDIKYRLEDLFGTKVFINNKKNKGKIEIEYYSEEDLQRILEVLHL
ncbi:ParB/RepB/Spo0J family partition protein [Clostridium malenominatum]|uniref:ParB/RepB/Spo0J family partition protein n=1 Tax=Clostridium malenominatum TaxID=1539 RepID=A0ABP3UAE2_9CLOT